MTTTDAFFLSWSRPTLAVALHEAVAAAAAPSPPKPFLARHPRLLEALRVLMHRPHPHTR